MRTQLSQFCEEFEQVVRPLLVPLKRTSESLASSVETLPGREILAELKDLGQQLEMLVDKVAEQQAYVLIFGPLKSGKSTLMNALSASYVSEVTSLPAYPCMVYVTHSERRQYTVSRYDGDAVVFTDPAALRLHVGRSHAELAERVRESTEDDEPFDPPVHFPKAIRRIDVKLPAGNMARSGAVLVDTPGLYSRMKFGYDRMTREFRNSAACAIFVVKSDNLFLEQVFEEFNELLELFSRIFLVVNLDSSKLDLAADGKLTPSLEQEDPLRIIEAFESLVMSSALKRAMEEGRLRIYPVDVLRAASRRLTAASRGSAEDGEPPADEARGQANFDAFLQDLTDYINSTDYLVAFLGDSLRRASTLLGELGELCRHKAVERLTASVEELGREKQDAHGRREAARKLSSIEWKPAFDELREKAIASLKEPARKLGERTTAAIDAAVAGWFESEASLQSLIDEHLAGLFTKHQQDLIELVRGELEERVTTGRAGIRVTAETAADLVAAKIDLSQSGRASLERVSPNSFVEPVAPALRAEQVPVKKRLVDWILLRTAAHVKRRVLGPADCPSLRIPVETKAARLGTPAREAIRRALDEYEGAFFASTLERVQRRLLGAYADAAREQLEIAFKDKQRDWAERVEEIDEQLNERKRVQNHLTRLQTQTVAAGGEVESLAARYGKADPDLLIQPIPASQRPLPSRVTDPRTAKTPAKTKGSELPTLG